MQNLKITSKDWSPFTSDAAKYAFVLLNVSGYDQKLMLGITRKLYDNVDEAKSWRNVIEHTLDVADDVPSDVTDAAKVVLYQLYGDMIRNIPRPGLPYGGVPMDNMYDENY